jgi:hypothetical protein
MVIADLINDTINVTNKTDISNTKRCQLHTESTALDDRSTEADACKVGHDVSTEEQWFPEGERQGERSRK